MEELTDEQVAKICKEAKHCKECKLVRIVEVEDKIVRAKRSYETCEKQIRQMKAIIKEYRKIMEKE